MTARDVPQVDVIVIGAGASGLLCAATCGSRGRSVLVIDHAARIGEKIRISGGGRCNFTNREVSAGHYQSANAHFCRSALARFTPQHLLALIEKHGIRYQEREEGQLFCETSAREIVAMLQELCDRAGVKMLLDCRVTNIRRHPGPDVPGADPACYSIANSEKEDRSVLSEKSNLSAFPATQTDTPPAPSPTGTTGYSVETSQGTFHCASLVIATGGLSYPKLGASGFGLDVARQFGLAVVPTRPALVPFVFAKAEREIFGELAGVSLDAAITCSGRRHAGRMLFTHRGLSGPAALQASLHWVPGDSLGIDLLPEKEILEALLARRPAKAEASTVLAEHLPKRLARIWCEQRGIARPLNQLSEKAIKAFAAGLHDWRLIPGGTEGYTTAEATCGGVDTIELSSKTMEATRTPGLYFIGEVVDVTGELGGYNLHWAWASGHAAGTAV